MVAPNFRLWLTDLVLAITSATTASGWIEPNKARYWLTKSSMLSSIRYGALTLSRLYSAAYAAVVRADRKEVNAVAPLNTVNVHLVEPPQRTAKQHPLIDADHPPLLRF